MLTFSIATAQLSPLEQWYHIPRATSLKRGTERIIEATVNHAHETSIRKAKTPRAGVVDDVSRYVYTTGYQDTEDVQLLIANNSVTAAETEQQEPTGRAEPESECPAFDSFGDDGHHTQSGGYMQMDDTEHAVDNRNEENPFCSTCQAPCALLVRQDPQLSQSLELESSVAHRVGDIDNMLSQRRESKAVVGARLTTCPYRESRSEVRHDQAKQDRCVDDVTRRIWRAHTLWPLLQHSSTSPGDSRPESIVLPGWSQQHEHRNLQHKARSHIRREKYQCTSP